MAVWHRWAFRFFERFRYRRSFFRQAARLGASDTWPENFLGLVQSLDTPFRLAGFMEENLHEQGQVRMFDVPKPAIITWQQKGGNSADWARFALEVLVHHGYEAFLFTALRRNRLEAQIVCIVKDPASDGWFHLSNLGMFGVYPDWDALASDLFADWGIRFVRDIDLRLVEEAARAAA